MVKLTKQQEDVYNKAKAGDISIDEGKKQLAETPVIKESVKDNLVTINKQQQEAIDKVNAGGNVQEVKQELEDNKITPANQSLVTRDDNNKLSTGFTPLKEKPSERQQVKDLENKGLANEVIIKKIQDQRTAEAKKLDELSVKEKENQIKATETEAINTNKQLEQENYVQGFNDLIVKGASEQELVKYLNSNTDLKNKNKQTLLGTYKESLKIKDDNTFITKYGNYTDEQLFTAYKNGEIMPGSEKYNLLSPEQKASFEIYRKQAEVISPVDNKQFETDKQILSFDTYLNQGKALFSKDIKARYESVLNTPEITQTAKDLEAKANAINDLDKTIKGITKDVQKEFPHSTASLQASIIADRTRDLTDSRDSLVLEYNSKKGTLATLKDNADRELKILQLEDQESKEIYNMALNQYNTDRNRMDKFKQIKLQEQSKILAEQRSRDWQLAMKENDRKYAESNKKGVYKTDVDGNLLYVIGGEASVVKSNDGKVVGVKKYKNYTDTISSNKEGGFTILRQYDDGKTEIFTRGIDGKDSFNSSMKVESAIGNVDSYKSRYYKKQGLYQCGEGVNNYTKSLGINSFHMGDTYKSKTDNINSEVPVIGGLAVWQPTTVKNKYGHTGVVTGYNEKTKEVMITDWNLNLDGKKNTHKVPLEQIFNSDGGFVDIGNKKPTTGTSDTGVSNFDEFDIPLYKAYNSDKGLTSAEQKAIPNYNEFKQKALLYGKEKAKEGTPLINNIIETAKRLKGYAKDDVFRRTATGQEYFRPEASDFNADLEYIISNLAMNNLIDLKSQGATFGALSGTELEMIKKGATQLDRKLSEKKWNAVLDKLISDVGRGLGEQTTETPKQSTQKQTLRDKGKQKNKTKDFYPLLNK